MVCSRIYRWEFIRCSAAVLGWRQCYGAPSIVESFIARIDQLAQLSVIEFEMAFERRSGETVQGNKRRRRVSISSEKTRLDLFSDDPSKLITRLQSGDSLLVYLEAENSYVEAKSDSESVAYDLEVLLHFKAVCFTRFLLLKLPATKVESVRSVTKKVGGTRKEIIEVRYKFTNEQLSETCTVGIDPETLNPLYSHSRVVRAGSVVSEDVDFLSIHTDGVRVSSLLNWQVPAGARRLERFRGRLPQ